MVCAVPPLNVVPDAAPAPPLLKVNAAVVLAVTVPDPPRAIDVPFTVKLALANLACAKVPLEMFDALIAVTLAADPLRVPMKLPDVVFPVTVRLDNVPTLVMLGCAAVVTVPAVVAVVADPVMLPVMVLVTVNPVNVPTDVILGCAAVVTVPAVTAVVAEPADPADPVMLPVMVLVTVNPVNVPTDVMLGCAAVVTVPAVVAVMADAAFATVPVTLPPGIDVSPAPDPLN
jgi:hypothetical protein